MVINNTMNIVLVININIMDKEQINTTKLLLTKF